MKKSQKKNTIVFVTFMAFGMFVYLIVKSVYFAPNEELSIPTNYKNVANKIQPTISSFDARLTIPSLKIDAHVQNVGITKKGNMSTPNNFFDVGLYKYGPLPGEKGSAIIDGHVDNGLGLKAVFGRLSEIKVGDDIYVEMKKGVKTHFVVTSLDQYEYNSPTDRVFNQNDDAYLKLITCAGTWIPNIHTHDKRLVVTAVKSDV